VTTYITGLASLNRKLGALPAAAKEVMQQGVTIEAQEMAATARALAPVDSGALRASIVATAAAEPAVVAGAAYAAHVEFGTHHSRREPFFYPAVRTGRARLLNRVIRGITAAVRRISST
jgi:HK97 gp10 family phage protein